MLHAAYMHANLSMQAWWICTNANWVASSSRLEHPALQDPSFWRSYILPVGRESRLWPHPLLIHIYLILFLLSFELLSCSELSCAHEMFVFAFLIELGLASRCFLTPFDFCSVFLCVLLYFSIQQPAYENPRIFTHSLMTIWRSAVAVLFSQSALRIDHKNCTSSFLIIE